MDAGESSISCTHRDDLRSSTVTNPVLVFWIHGNDENSGISERGCVGAPGLWGSEPRNRGLTNPAGVVPALLSRGSKIAMLGFRMLGHDGARREMRCGKFSNLRSTGLKPEWGRGRLGPGLLVSKPSLNRREAGLAPNWVMVRRLLKRREADVENARCAED